jgi:DNA recombination protein RmuC
MDALHLVLLVLTLLGFGAAVWMGMRASALVVEARGAATRAERAEAEHAGLRAHAEEVRERCAGLESRNVALAHDLEAVRREHAQEVQRVQDVAGAHVRGVEERERRMREDFGLMEAKFTGLVQQQFKALAGEALKGSTDEFLKLAGEKFAGLQRANQGELEQKRLAFEQVVRPLAETLQRTDAKLAEFDKNRASTHAALSEHLRQMGDAHTRLHEETRRLAEALRKPEVRGAYGEMQLRRVAELAGMVAYCDFSVQESVQGAESAGGLEGPDVLRPDMVVRLPNGRSIVVDAKTNIRAYLDAVQAGTPEESSAHMERFAKHVADQATRLSRKEYWKSVPGSPEFVVMFIPGDQFVDAALSRKPDMLEHAARQGVILASPATLIGLLRAVAVGYKEEKLARTAEELRELGRRFHDQMATAIEPLANVGVQLDRAVRSYNQFVASYESRLRPTMLRFEESGVRGKKDVPMIVTVDAGVRKLQTKTEPAEKSGLFRGEQDGG